MIVLGVDAGGSKTLAVVADENGTILGEGLSGAGNHQICGIETASFSIRSAIETAVKNAGINSDDIAYAVLGISGADRTADFEILNPAVSDILNRTPFKVMNDSWLGLRLASDHFAGIVSICGTGAAHAGRNPSGRELIFRNLDHSTGNLGGGAELSEEALHYAFRSEEGTWEKSALEEAIPEIFGVPDMEGVCDIVFNDKMTSEQMYAIPIKVLSLARENDAVCVFLLERMSREMGYYAAGLLKRLDMCNEKVPAVMIGSLFATGDPLLVDPYMKIVNSTAPSVYPFIPEERPVMGAVRLALDAVIK